MGRAALGLLCAAGAAFSLLIPAAPGYDAWAWLVWGREVSELTLETVAGPAWKPLPVAVTALLSGFGDAAPALWLFVARCGALAAVGLAFLVGRRFGGIAGGVVAAVGVVLTGGFVRHAAVGDAEPLLIALALAAFERAVSGRHRQALVLGGLAALVRPETWPFLAAYALWRWRSERAVVVALALVVPAAWVVPELLSSGELLRSADRARVPNPGQPATEAFPALATLAAALGVVFAPTAVGAFAARRAGALPALAGVAWIALVAAMSQAGFSGEERYLLPGAALIAVSGGVGAARLAQLRAPLRLAVALALLAALPFAAARSADIADLGPRLAYQQRLAADLERAIDAAGGRSAVLACGRPAVGRYRGTLLAWALRVPKRLVRADGAAGGATFRSRLTARGPASPPPRGSVLAANPRWTVTCAARASAAPASATRPARRGRPARPRA